MRQQELCNTVDCCTKCCESSGEYNIIEDFTVSNCQVACNNEGSCTFDDPVIQETCLLAQKFSHGSDILSHDNILNCQSSGIILSHSQQPHTNFLSQNGSSSIPVQYLVFGSGFIVIAVVVVMSLCSKKPNESSIKPYTDIETSKNREEDKKFEYSIENIKLPESREQNKVLRPITYSSEKVSIKSKDSVKSKKKKSSRSKLGMNDSFEVQEQEEEEVVPFEPTPTVSDQEDEKINTVKKEKSKKRKKKKNKNKKKFAPREVSFKIGSNYSVANDASVVSVMSKESVSEYNGSSLPRAVGGQKRAAFSREEVRHIMSRSGSFEKSKMIQKYDDIDNSITDMRVSGKSDGNTEKTTENNRVQAPSVYKRQVSKDRKSVYGVEIEDVFDQEENLDINIEEDEELRLVHNNRETRLDI